MSALGIFLLSLAFGAVIAAAFALTTHGWLVLGVAVIAIALVNAVWRGIN